MPLLFHSLEDHVGARARPILGIDVLEHDEVTEFLRQVQRHQLAHFRRTGVCGVGWPKQRRRTARDRLDKKLRRIELEPDVLGPADRQVRMVVGVVPDLVAFRDNSPDEVRIFFRVCANEEKSGLHICFFQDVENLRSPFGVGPIIEGNRDLMRRARALMIKRGELRKLRIRGGEIAILIDRERTHAVGLRFIHGNNLALADIGDRVGASQNFEGRPRLRFHLEIPRNSERVPDRHILRAEAVDREPTRLHLPHLAQLVQERHRIEEPDGVILVRVFVIKIRAVIRRGDIEPGHFGVARPAHRFGETDQLCLFRAVGPIVSIAAERDDPLLRLRAVHQDVEPAFEPAPRTERAGRIDVGRFVEKQRDEAIDVIRDLLEIDVIEVLSGLDAKPELFVIVVQRVCESV